MSHFTAGCPYPHDQCKCYDDLRQDVGRLTRERNEWEANEQEQYREVLLLQAVVRKTLPHHCPELTDGEVAAVQRAFDNGHAIVPESSLDSGRTDAP